MITKVVLNETEQRVDIYLDHEKDIQVRCPECDQFYGVYDHSPERVYRHPDTCQMATYIHVRPPRVNCPDHGVKQITSELGENGSEMTYAFESLVIRIAQECSIEATSRLCSWAGIRAGMPWKELLTEDRAGKSIAYRPELGWMKKLSPEGINMNPWSMTWTTERSNTLRMIASRKVWKAIISSLVKRSWPEVEYPYFQESLGINYIHQADLVGPRYIKNDGRFYSLHIIDRGSHRVFIHPQRRKDDLSVASALIRCWKTMGVPDFLQFDNELSFRGSNRHPRSLGVVLRLCLYGGRSRFYPSRRALAECRGGKLQ